MARRYREKTPKAMGMGIQIQHPCAKIKFVADMLLAAVSIAFGISCIRAEIPPRNGIKKPDKPDNNTTKVGAIMSTMLFSIVNFLFQQFINIRYRDSQHKSGTNIYLSYQQETLATSIGGGIFVSFNWGNRKYSVIHWK